MSLVLEEFYRNIKYTAVSSKTGNGFDKLFKLCDEVLSDYMNQINNSS
jgi:hypothetical protein